MPKVLNTFLSPLCGALFSFTVDEVDGLQEGQSILLPGTLYAAITQIQEPNNSVSATCLALLSPTPLVRTNIVRGTPVIPAPLPPLASTVFAVGAGSTPIYLYGLDQSVFVDTRAASATVTALATPPDGTTFSVYDIYGNAGTNVIAIDSAGSSFYVFGSASSSGTASINTNFGRASFIYSASVGAYVQNG